MYLLQSKAADNCASKSNKQTLEISSLESI